MIFLILKHLFFIEDYFIDGLMKHLQVFKALFHFVFYTITYWAEEKHSDCGRVRN